MIQTTLCGRFAFDLAEPPARETVLDLVNQSRAIMDRPPLDALTPCRWQNDQSLEPLQPMLGYYRMSSRLYFIDHDHAPWGVATFALTIEQVLQLAELWGATVEYWKPGMTYAIADYPTLFNDFHLHWLVGAYPELVLDPPLASSSSKKQGVLHV